MIDWTASMQQTYEFYEVDPNSFKDKKLITVVKTGNINWDSETETLGSATFDVTDLVGECYIRVYLIVTQGNEKEKRPLGTFLAQTPSSTFDGKTRNVSVDAYSPLLELKEKNPPIGYFVAKGKDVMEEAYGLTDENARAPIIKPITPSNKLTSDFVADVNDTWLTFISDLITAAHTSSYYEVEYINEKYVRTAKSVKPESTESSSIGTTEGGEPVYQDLVQDWSQIWYCIIPDEAGNNHYYRVIEQDGSYEYSDELEGNVTGILVGGNAKTTSGHDIYTGYHYISRTTYYCAVVNPTRYKLALDEMGNIYYAPEQDAAAMSPVWTYTDDNSSILYPEMTMDHDLYGIPNVVEVIYADGENNYRAVARNDDPNSPISTVARGREILYRETNPDIYGVFSQKKLDQYAEQLLKALSTIEYTISYTHGYCPVKVGDCVRMNYSRAGLTNVKAKVIKQSIALEPGCPVTETAVFTTKLWG